MLYLHPALRFCQYFLIFKVPKSCRYTTLKTTLIIESRYHFTCGESKLFKNVTKYQNIKSKIADSNSGKVKYELQVQIHE